MEEIATLALLGSGATMLAAFGTAAYSVWRQHQKARQGSILEVKAGEQTFEFDLGEIEKVKPGMLRKASEAVRAESARAA